MIANSPRKLAIEGHSQPKTRIHVVDDKPVDGHFLRLALSDAQLDCEGYSGAEALAFVR